MKQILVVWGLALLMVQTLAARAATAAPADLRIGVTSASFRVGEDGVYRVTVRNETSVATDGSVRIETLLPEGVSFRKGEGAGWFCVGGTRQVACERSGIGAADTATIVLTVGVCDAAFPSIATTFRVVSDDDPAAENNETTRVTAVKSGQCAPPTGTPTRPRPASTRTPTRTPTPSPAPPTGVELALSGSSARELMVGSRATYRYRIANLGDTPTTARILFVDTLPAGLTFMGAVGDRWTCAAIAQVVTCERERSLAPRGRSALTISVRVEPAAYPFVVNEAAIFSAGDGDASNNSLSRAASIRKPNRRPLRPTVTR